MRKIFYLGMLVFGMNLSFCQLYVSPSSYVFAKNNFLFVNGNVELNGGTAGNILLRNDAQLLQGTTGTSTNKGTGKLSVFQEGNVDNYEYNYWCSPVGNASATLGNEDFGVTMLNVPTDNYNSAPATILPAISSNRDGLSSNGALTIASYWILKFLSSTTYSQWIRVGAATNISAGQGFSMKGTSGSDTTLAGEAVANNPFVASVTPSAQRYDFRGKPNDGNITVFMEPNKYTLTGNPYPSAIDLKNFLLSTVPPAVATPLTTGIAYFWEQDKSVNSHYIAAYQGGYGQYSTAGANGFYNPPTFYTYDGSGTQGATTGFSGTSYQRRFSPVGQGFMLQGAASTPTGSSITMNNSFRVFVKEGAANLSQFSRNATSNQIGSPNGYLPAIPSVSGFDYTTVPATETPRIIVKSIIDNSIVTTLPLAFDDNATDGVDWAMDALSPNTSASRELYYPLDNQSYVINVTTFNVNKRIPLGLRCTQPAKFKIFVDEIINFTNAENIYLHDKETDVYTDIKNGVFEVDMPAGNNATKYEITFIDSALNNPTHSSQSLAVLQNNTNQLLTISNPKLASLKSVTLYDISGKLLLSKVNLAANASYEYSTSSYSEGVYLVKIETTDNQSLTEKIIIKNNR